MHQPIPSNWHNLPVLLLLLLIVALGAAATAENTPAIPVDPATVTLAVKRDGNKVTVSWAPSVTGYILESTGSLSDPIVSPVPNVVNNSVVIPVEAGNKYFRLRTSTGFVGDGVQELRPIIVQGAMPVETERLAGRLDGVSIETVGGWTFWRGTLDGWPV